MKDVVKSRQDDGEYKLINGQRVKVNRRRRRSNLNSYYALAVIFAAVIVLILCMTVFFNVKAVNIQGVKLYTKEQILAVGGVNSGVNLIRTDTKAVETRLKNTLVYIDDVQVSRKYPSELEIKVTEAVKAAQIEKDGKYYILSESGRILEADVPLDTSLMQIKGFELKSLEPGSALESEDAFKTKILDQLVGEIEALDFENINEIDLTDRTDIKMTYDGRIDIRLGSSVDIDYKLTYIKAVIDKSLSDNYEGTLRYNGVNSGISAIPKSDSDSASDSGSDEAESSQDAADADTQINADDPAQSNDSGTDYSQAWSDGTGGDDYGDYNGNEYQDGYSGDAWDNGYTYQAEAY
ncbi:FtsQ-type POTRA domain-containing protein [Ruminococcus sp. Marseille-P6503]|uniref:cell division protein FtsQ/DivIB n=1 Tax=Ruminococcus sp. Marseille-P6503 TaxID=2364796 RepID=UPI000F52FC4C|nr:FtsQ-type POTRA domain-containing protein [Ruminococcus sp. Marseille-P6503]